MGDPRRHAVSSPRARFLLVAFLAAFACAALGGPGGTLAAPAKPAAKSTTTKTATKTAKPAARKTAAAAKAEPDSLPRLEAAVRRDSTNVKALYRLGIAYLDRDRPIDAAVTFQKAVALRPDYVEAWVNLGAAEDANGHGSMARIDYRKALSLRPGDEIANCRMASSFYAAGIKDSAMDVIRDILKTNDKSACAYFTLGVSFADASMFREAIRVWQKVVELAPKSPEAESAQESIKLLQEYLGPQEMLSAQSGGAEGVAPGAGGPGITLPGGEMGGPKFDTTPKNSTTSRAATTPAPEKNDPGAKPASGGDKK